MTHTNMAKFKRLTFLVHHQVIVVHVYIHYIICFIWIGIVWDFIGTTRQNGILHDLKRTPQSFVGTDKITQKPIFTQIYKTGDVIFAVSAFIKEKIF